MSFLSEPDILSLMLLFSFLGIESNRKSKSLPFAECDKYQKYTWEEEVSKQKPFPELSPVLPVYR